MSGRQSKKWSGSDMTRSSEVFLGIRDAIMTGQYAYNERLPSERNLSIRFDAARNTVRAALEQLEQASLVRRKFGSGTFVSYRSDGDREDVLEETSPLELIETRIAIEPHIVRLAILHASNRDLNHLESALRMSLGTDEDPNAFSEADEAFHMALANCCQNPLLKWVYQMINDIRSHEQWSAQKDHVLTPDRIRYYIKDHERLLEAIRRRDQNLAADIISSHLNEAYQDLLGQD